MRLSTTGLLATAGAALALAAAGGALAAANAAPVKAGGATPTLTQATVTTPTKPALPATKAVAAKTAAPGHASVGIAATLPTQQHSATLPTHGVSAPARAFDATIAQKALPSTFTSDVTFDQSLAADTSAGKTCFVNKAEVPINLDTPPVRFNAEFKLDQKISISGFTASLESVGDPFTTRADFKVSDLSFTTVRKADLSAECLGLDRNFTITLKNISGHLTFGPPTAAKGLNFRYQDTVVSIGSITISNDGKLLKEFINKTISDVLAAPSNKLALEAALASAFGAAGPGLAQLLTSVFKVQLPVASGEKIKAVDYQKTARNPRCAASPCALYSFKK